MPAGGPYRLEIQVDEEITIQNVMIGDVFLLGGQSNMELPVRRVMERFGDEINTVNDSLIRMFDVPRKYFLERNKKNCLRVSGEVQREIQLWILVQWACLWHWH